MEQGNTARAEFGDFQTPPSLARDVCEVIRRTGFSLASVVEPSCGRGTFLRAALEAFPEVRNCLGVDRDTKYVEEAKTLQNHTKPNQHIQILRSNFFNTDWPSLITSLPDPLLILGNPPWVTNATLGTLSSANLPKKANHDNLQGIDALTGKSNFDISEWMLRQNLCWLADRSGMLAVLCKTAVARKVLSYAWSHKLPIESAAIYRIDAKLHFNASVDACLLVVICRPGATSKDCSDYPSLDALTPDAVFGVRNGNMVADVRLYERWHDLLVRGLSGWRSGIKHDCSKVFELVENDAGYRNGLDMAVDVEAEVVFPLLKSSDLARDRRPRTWLLVPQRTMRSRPEELQQQAPKAWQYLLGNAALLERRASSIYRNRPRFSIFGVGDYSFSPWKVAIAGLYKKLKFVEVAPFQRRPVVLDDTCYFFACRSERECRALRELVESGPAQEFWSAFIFWDAKRPITAQTLNLLDFASLAKVAGMESDTTRILAERQLVRFTERAHQGLLFREDFEEYCVHPKDVAGDGVAVCSRRLSQGEK